MPYLKMAPVLWNSGKLFLSCWCNALPRKAMGNAASAELIWSSSQQVLKLTFKKLFSKAFLWNSGQAVLMMVSNVIFFSMCCSLRMFQHSSLLGCSCSEQCEPALVPAQLSQHRAGCEVISWQFDFNSLNYLIICNLKVIDLNILQHSCAIYALSSSLGTPHSYAW